MLCRNFQFHRRDPTRPVPTGKFPAPSICVREHIHLVLQKSSDSNGIFGTQNCINVRILYKCSNFIFSAREKDSYIKLCSTIVNEMLPFVNNCLSHLFPQAALAETLGMTLRESHQICQLDLVTLTEPLQAYIPKEEDIQIPLKKLEVSSEANSEAPITPETTVPPENPDKSTPDLTSEEPTTEKRPESEESLKTEDQNSPVETTGEPTAEPVSDPSEVTPTPAESAPEAAQTASEPMEAATAEVSDTTTVEVKPENQPETEVQETKKD